MNRLVDAIFWGHDRLDRKERLQGGIGAVAVVALLLIGAEILSPGLGKAAFSLSPLLLTGTYLFIANQYAKEQDEPTDSPHASQDQTMNSALQTGVVVYSEPNPEYVKNNNKLSNPPSPIHSNNDEGLAIKENQVWLPPPPPSNNKFPMPPPTIHDENMFGSPILDLTINGIGKEANLFTIDEHPNDQQTSIDDQSESTIFASTINGLGGEPNLFTTNELPNDQQFSTDDLFGSEFSMPIPIFNTDEKQPSQFANNFVL